MFNIVFIFPLCVCNGLETSPGFTPPFTHRLLKIGTSYTITPMDEAGEDVLTEGQKYG